MKRLLEGNWTIHTDTRALFDDVITVCGELGLALPMTYINQNAHPYVTCDDVGLLSFKDDWDDCPYHSEEVTDAFLYWLKLAPRNPQEENIVMAALAKMRGKTVEAQQSDGSWCEEIPHLLDINSNHRLKETTPLPISRAQWDWIDKRFIYAAMDARETIYFYTTLPHRHPSSSTWVNEGKGEVEILTTLTPIDTTGIDWELSLTQRPE